MLSILINGNQKLEGIVEVSGSKNSALPILASTILAGKEYIIKNVPDIDDVKFMLEILIMLGCSAKFDSGTCYINTKDLNTYDITDELSKKLRSSIIFLGPMLSRSKIAKITYPGGCDIGSRPIDFHLEGLKQLGVEVQEQGDNILCIAENTHSGTINLQYPSVGATENLMLFATSVEGQTTITNTAKEPEIIDLQNFLLMCGYEISGAGTDTIVINGKKANSINSINEYSIMSDRIEAGTFASMAASTDSKILIKNINTQYIKSISNLYKNAGCYISEENNSLYIKSNGIIKSENIITGPYPSFPTDLQAQTMAALSIADGISTIEETVFENRYKHVIELNKMGADITINGRLATIKGVKKLHSANVNIRDLRGGAALIIAALSAEGMTILNGMEHVYRGYEHLITKLTQIGADIK